MYSTTCEVGVILALLNVWPGVSYVDGFLKIKIQPLYLVRWELGICFKCVDARIVTDATSSFNRT